MEIVNPRSKTPSENQTKKKYKLPILIISFEIGRNNNPFSKKNRQRRSPLQKSRYFSPFPFKIRPTKNQVSLGPGKILSKRLHKSSNDKSQGRHSLFSEKQTKTLEKNASGSSIQRTEEKKRHQTTQNKSKMKEHLNSLFSGNFK